MKISIIIIGQKIDFSAKTRRNQEDEKKLGLTNWVAAEPMGEDATSIDSIFERVIHTDSVTAPAKRFVRVRVTAN